MKRANKSTLLVVVLGMSLLIVGLLEFAGILNANPTAKQLLARLDGAWQRTPGYRVDISVGRWEPMGDGPLTCREWSVSKKDYIRASRDLFGFWHTERWLPSSYHYYQPGAGLQADIALLHEDEVDFARWMISGFPSLSDLMTVIGNGKEYRVIGSGGSRENPLWIMELQPSYPANVPDALRHSRFFTEMFEAKWRVWLSEESGLPSHVVVTGVGGKAPLRIGIANLETPAPKLPADWRQVMQTECAVKRRIRLNCDAASRSSVETTQRRINDEITAWKKRLYPNYGAQAVESGAGGT